MILCDLFDGHDFGVHRKLNTCYLQPIDKKSVLIDNHPLRTFPDPVTTANYY
jgi:hypothetical protein